MKKNRILSLLLVMAMLFSLLLAGCGGTPSSTPTPTGDSAATDGTAPSESEPQGEEPEDDFDYAAYTEKSWELYEANLGEFYDAYLTAKDEVNDLDLRYALMAIAEAKLMESGTMLPTTANGGYYGMTRVANRTVPTVLYGTDNNRFHSAIVTNEIFKSEDVAALREMWTELKGTGTYLDSVKAYLAEHGYTTKDTYTFSYISDPATWDILASSQAPDSEALVNTYDGLMEYDCENVLQPALAESYEVSDDGLTYTFHIRQGVKWVDSQGREVADVTADDWVAGMQHLMDSKEGLETLLNGIILNATEYNSGEVTDFSEVGVKAVDEYTLVYTLANPTPFFLTMIAYSPFAPLCRSYYQSQGGTFGADYDIDGAGTYGTSPDNIVYCGPYLVTNWTEANIVVYSYNESYWNPDSVNVHTITWLYNDGSEPTKGYNDFLAGTTDTTTLNTSSLEVATKDGNFDLYSYVTLTDACSFQLFMGLDRGTYANFNDSTVCISPKADDVEAQERTHAAMNNLHFRHALTASLDRVGWNAQATGDALASVSLRNSYTPGDFVYLEKDVTVDINGTATTFPAGTYYGVIMQAQLDADGSPIKVWDPETSSGDGFDGWYNPEYAASELALAVEELAAEGVVIDAENPITIDIVYPADVVTYTNKAMAFKQSVESVTGGLVVVNTVPGSGYIDWYNATYYPTYGYLQNCDINDCTGWIPDYGDPSSYLDTILPYYDGYMTKAFGLF